MGDRPGHGFQKVATRERKDHRTGVSLQGPRGAHSAASERRSCVRRLRRSPVLVTTMSRRPKSPIRRLRRVGDCEGWRVDRLSRSLGPGRCVAARKRGLCASHGCAGTSSAHDDRVDLDSRRHAPDRSRRTSGDQLLYEVSPWQGVASTPEIIEGPLPGHPSLSQAAVEIWPAKTSQWGSVRIDDEHAARRTGSESGLGHRCLPEARAVEPGDDRAHGAVEVSRTTRIPGRACSGPRLLQWFGLSTDGVWPRSYMRKRNW